MTSEKVDDHEAIRILLSSATEGYTGLYEAIWELNSRFSSARLSEKYRAADAALRELERLGWIEFVRGDYSRREADRFEVMEPGEIPALLSKPHAWYPEYDHYPRGSNYTLDA